MPNAGEVCNREVVTAHGSDGLVETAARMRDQHVGDVVVIERRNDMRVPVGILTDRDIVVSVVARNEQYLDKLNVADVLVRSPITAREDEDIFHVVKRMRAAGVRRMPVVDRLGGLVGIISMDDVLQLLADSFTQIAELSDRQRRRERKERR